jgi:hypothetical protein
VVELLDFKDSRVLVITIITKKIMLIEKTIQVEKTVLVELCESKPKGQNI